MDVWLELMGQRGELDNHHIRRGTYLEPAIIRWAAETYDWKVTQPGTLVHPEHPIVIATPDGIIDETTVLEVKCPQGASTRLWGPPETDQVPKAYRCQVTWQMAVTGLKWATLVVFMHGDIHRYHVEYDPKLFERLLASAQGFWKHHVETCTPPRLDGGSGSDEFIAKMFPHADNPPIEDNSDKTRELVTMFAAAKDMLKAAEVEKQRLAQCLKFLIGDASGLVGEGFTIHYRNNKDSQKTDWKGLATKLGATAEQIEAHTKTAPGARVLRDYIGEV